MPNISSKHMVLFNGPPRVGKDTAADAVLENFPGSERVKNTTPMDRALQAMFNLNNIEYRLLRETYKDDPHPIFGGKTMRQVLISMSEDWCKPFFGKSVFGKIMVSRFLPDSRLLVCSDSGFEEECVPYIEKLGAENILLIRVHRTGCDFSNDSRSYLDLAKYGVTSLDVNNNWSMGAFQNAVVDLVSKFIAGTQ